MILHPAIPLDDQRPHLKALRYIISSAETATFRRRTIHIIRQQKRSTPCLKLFPASLSPISLSSGSPNIGESRKDRSLTDQGWFYRSAPVGDETVSPKTRSSTPKDFLHGKSSLNLPQAIR